MLPTLKQYRFAYTVTIVVVTMIHFLIYNAFFLLNTTGDVYLFKPYILFSLFASCFSVSVNIIKDIWSLWPYAYHSLKFIIPDGDLPAPGDTGLLMRSRLFYAFGGGFTLALVTCLIGWFAISYFPLNWRLWIWFPTIAALPLVNGLLAWFFGKWFLAQYVQYIKKNLPPKRISGTAYLITYFLLPELAAVFLVNAALILPLQKTLVFFTDPGSISLALMGAVGFISLITFAFIFLSVKADTLKYFSGDLFSGLVDISGWSRLHEPPERMLLKSARGLILPLVVTVLFIECTIALAQFFRIELPFYLCLFYIICVFLIVFLIFRWFHLKGSLISVYTFYKDFPQYHYGGQLTDSYKYRLG